MTVAEVGKPMLPQMQQQLERDLRDVANAVIESLTPLRGFDGRIRLQAGYERWWPVAPGMVTCDTTLYPPPSNAPVLAFMLANLAEYSPDAAGAMRPGGATVSINAVFNSIVPIVCEGEPVSDDERGGMYPAPLATGEIQGFKTYFVHQSPTPLLVLVRASARPLWVPVSQERYLRSLIRRYRVAMAPAKGSSGNATPYQTWVREKPQRDKEIREAVRELRALGLVEQAKELQAQMERTEREMTERLKEAEPADARSLQTGNEQLASLEAQLQSLSPSERAAPAYFSPGARGIGLLGSRADKDAMMLVQVNPDYFDAALPRTALQVAVIQVTAERVTAVTRDEWRDAAARRMLQSVAWERVAQMLR